MLRVALRSGGRSCGGSEAGEDRQSWLAQRVGVKIGRLWEQSLVGWATRADRQKIGLDVLDAPQAAQSHDAVDLAAVDLEHVSHAFPAREGNPPDPPPPH